MCAPLKLHFPSLCVHNININKDSNSIFSCCTKIKPHISVTEIAADHWSHVLGKSFKFGPCLPWNLLGGDVYELYISPMRCLGLLCCFIFIYSQLYQFITYVVVANRLGCIKNHQKRLHINKIRFYARMLKPTAVQELPWQRLSWNSKQEK